MAKYKLIKNYPACNLEIGSYIEFLGNCHQIINSNGNFLKSDLEKFTEFWEKVEDKSILITEDGVEIFKGDIYWRLIAVIKEDRTFTFLEKSDEKGAFPYRGGGGKFFSTKEAAEKYLDENKPMYSKKEVRDFGGYILRNLKGVMPMKLLFELWLREKGN